MTSHKEGEGVKAFCDNGALGLGQEGEESVKNCPFLREVI